MPDITLIIQIPGRVRNSLVSKHTVDVDGDEAAAELPDEFGARGGLQPDGSLARNIILRAAGDVALCGLHPARRLSLQEQRLVGSWARHFKSWPSQILAFTSYHRYHRFGSSNFYTSFWE